MTSFPLRPNQQAALRNAIEPHPGDTWTDNDPRVPGRDLRILAVDAEAPGMQRFALVETVIAGRARRTRIGLWRFNPNRRDGYTLTNRQETA